MTGVQTCALPIWRAGGPKALKLRDGQFLWRWQCERLVQLGARPLAVLHPSAWQPGQVRADPDAPLFASLLAGLAAVPPGDVWVLPVDCPCPPRAVWVALLAAARECEARGRSWLAIQPELDGRGGHPVLISAAWRAELMSLSPTSARLDHVLAAAPQRVRVPVEDPGVLANFNFDGIAR